VAIPDPDGLNDTVSINLQFANGSIGNLSYFSNGSQEMPKEYVEVYDASLVGIIRDFKVLEIHSTGKPFRKKSFIQNKGQAFMVNAFIKNIKEGRAPLISADEIFAVTRTTFAVLESLRTHRAVSL
jgi:predicted dehydrogenase